MLEPKKPENEMSLEERLPKVRILIMVMQGGLCENRVVWGPDGLQQYAVSGLDVFGLKSLLELGKKAYLLAPQGNEVARQLCRSHGMQLAYHSGDKDRVVQSILHGEDADKYEACMMGVDLDDLQAMNRCAFSASASDAHTWVRDASHFVCTKPGGQGALRELVELILRDYTPEVI